MVYPHLKPKLIVVLYTISNLAITSLFPSRTQALAGGVFNTVAQIGNSVGLAITSIIAASVTAAERSSEGSRFDCELRIGYKMKQTHDPIEMTTAHSSGQSLGLRPESYPNITFE